MTARTYIVVLLLLAGRVALGQDDFGSIHMTVLDAETNRPIPFATVFVSQTTIGGNTNEQGVIDIKKIPLGSHLLVISEVGHVSQQRKVVIRGPQTIHMTVKLAARVLAEVVVVAKHDRKWRRHLKRFEKLFFGPDHFKQCEIKNPSVLHFEIEHGEFTADAKEALKIENNFLGYNLRFTIGNCFFNAKKFTILGNIAYEEKQGTEKQMSRWKENREKVYRGSPQHFLRSVLDSTLDKDGFKVYNDITDSEKIFRGSTLSANLGKTIVRDSIEKRVTPAAYGMYSFGLPGRLEVHYLRKRAWSLAYTDIGHSISWFEVKPGTQIIVSRSGIIQNPESITVVGNMSKLRVADWLPLNYKYAEDFAPEPIIPKRPGMALLEKPYVQTDRDYYYNGETMWLKGYMSYTVPLMKDTLSRSAHVELSDSNGNIIATKFYPMEDGNFEGDIPLGKNWRPGSYQLKVYTAWMLNFDRRMIFTKTINILGEFEAVKVAKDYQISTDTLPNIWLQSDKKQYSPREKITLTIDVTDSLEFSTGSDLSISVTDLEQAVPHKKEKTIITNYLYEEIPLDDPNKEVAYDIEYGVPFNGRFILGRQQTQGSLTFFQDN
ncbi:MAG TPA: carboxypeptidase-like regulatory domain-containing protein, partial [Cyclobacteriaceae bacterium]